MTLWAFIGAFVMWIGGITLGGWLVVHLARKRAPRLEDPAMYLFVLLVGVAIYCVAKFA